MFIAREHELAIIKEQLTRKSRTVVLVYGKRRVGKSALIEQALKTHRALTINHLCIQSSYAGNLEHLSRSVCQALKMPELSFNSITDVFDFLKTQKRSIVLVLDEYQYLKQSLKLGEMDSLMQLVVDTLPANVKLILCGSYITLMRELLEESNPLFGRLSAILHVEGFDAFDAAQFYAEVSAHEKIANYAVFGGSPYVLSNIDFSAPLKDNIVKMLLPQTSLLRSHIENVMLREVQKSYDVRILELIGNGKKRYSEILAALKTQNNGLLDKQLKALVGMETLRRVSPINRQSDPRKQFYEIDDNLMRMYFCYVFGQEARLNRLGAQAFYEQVIEPSLTQFISRRMEQIVLQYFMRKSRAKDLRGVTDFGPYWYDDPSTHTNGEFDCVLVRQKAIDVYECKFYQKPMSLDECRAEEKQVRLIPGATVRKVGFICSAGFDFESDEYDLISGDKLFAG